jgi:hypothetical protein
MNGYIFIDLFGRNAWLEEITEFSALGSFGRVVEVAEP